MFELLTSKLEPFTERVCIVWPILAFWTRKETLLSIVAAMFHVLVFAVPLNTSLPLSIFDILPEART